MFKVDYLGGWMPTYTLNFSHGSAGVLAQYYNFLRLGREGYRQIMTNCLQNAQHLAKQLEKSKKFTMIHTGDLLPIVAMRLTDKIKSYSVFDLSSKLRERGWVMSAYTLPPDAERIAILRVVVRENFGRDMVNLLVQDILNACEQLEKHETGPRPPPSSGKHRPIC